MKLIDPACQYVGGVTIEFLCQFEEAGAGLHITCLVNDNYTQHTSARFVFFF
jgi:hypothetical protein